MSKFSTSARLVTLAGVAAVLAAAMPSTAIAKDKGEHTITVPAAALPDASSKLCMPRKVIDKSKHSPLPKTVCYTQAEWAEKGVTIVVDKD
jgi:hypothetical protein